MREHYMSEKVFKERRLFQSRLVETERELLVAQSVIRKANELLDDHGIPVGNTGLLGRLNYLISLAELGSINQGQC